MTGFTHFAPRESRSIFNLMNKASLFLLFWLGLALSGHAIVDPDFQMFVLMGQSNMEGFDGIGAEDRATNPRIKVLAYTNCAVLGREYDKWYSAAPPLHGCGAGVGPGDYFAKAMVDSFPKITVGLIPTAIAGVDIDFFRKGVVSRRRNEFSIPPDNKRTGAYDMILEKAREAQKVGVIRGFLFHQGESDAGDEAWVGKVKGMVADLRMDLSLGDSVPFLAGELRYDGCCANHNPIIAKLPANIPGAYVISAKRLPGRADQAHFSLASERELGRRYATKMVELLRKQRTTEARGGLASSGRSAIDLRYASGRNGPTVSCTACSGFVLMGLDGKRVGESRGGIWNIPDAKLQRGIYFLRATGTAVAGGAISLLIGQ
ncbi:MAG: hypothetical protein JWP91_2573 [Fibrobacteres bacterium]|nr:hypothetical protein [Fibrobacterota bacterium]